MYRSKTDERVEELREQARQELIAQYEAEAGIAAREYGFLNIQGHEVPDPTIIDPPLGYIKQPDLMEMMRRMIRNELSQAIDNTEYETFEEADDFDIDDDPVDYTSPYEEYFDPSPGAPKGPPGQIHPDRQDPNAALDQAGQNPGPTLPASSENAPASS